MSENARADLLIKYNTLLLDYSKCMRPHLEYIRDRLNFNRAYVESDLEVFCVNERQNLKLNIAELDKLSEQNLS